jgi:recombinational DNA repair protein (RecF pathway)
MVHLDGNAAAGTLSELFTLEITTAIATCAGCGATGPLGAVHVYPDGPGIVLRCAVCSEVLLRVAHTPGAVHMDMRGIAVLVWPRGG